MDLEPQSQLVVEWTFGEVQLDADEPACKAIDRKIWSMNIFQNFFKNVLGSQIII